MIKLMFWVGVGLWVLPQLERQIFARLDGKRYEQ